MLYYVNPMYMAKRSARKFERAVQIAENKNGGVAKSSNQMIERHPRSMCRKSGKYPLVFGRLP